VGASFGLTEDVGGSIPSPPTMISLVNSCLQRSGAEVQTNLWAVHYTAAISIARPDMGLVSVILTVNLSG